MCNWKTKMCSTMCSFNIKNTSCFQVLFLGRGATKPFQFLMHLCSHFGVKQLVSKRLRQLRSANCLKVVHAVFVSNNKIN